MRDVSKIIKYHLNEYGYRTAALPHGANYNAKQDSKQTLNPNADSKMIKSNDIRLEAITLALHDNFPLMTLKFIETDKANQSYPVVFQFEKVVLDNDERFVFKGKISVCGKPFETGCIEYQYIPGKKWPSNFYRVTYSGNGVLKHKFPLEPHPRFTRDVEEVWAFMRNFKYAEKDNETTVNLNGPTNSKKH